MSTHPARRRQLRTWSPAAKQEHLQAVPADSGSGAEAGQELLDLASNDYLSLCRHPSLIAAAEASFSSGETTLTDLLDTLSSIRAAESTSLELHAAALAAHRELESAAGAPLELADSPNSDDEPGVDR